MKMSAFKNSLPLLGLTVLLALCAPALAQDQAEDHGLLEGSEVSVSGSMDYYSKYCWRGYTLDENPVVQPAFNISYDGFNLNLWASMPVTNRNNSTAVSNETDIAFSYSRDMGPLALSLGHISYHVPANVSPVTNEYFIGVNILPLPALLALTYYNDYNDGDGTKGSYFSFDASRVFTLWQARGITVSPSAHLGAWKDYLNLENGGDFFLGLKFGLPLTDTLSASPSLYYFAPTGDLADEAVGAQKAGVYGGLSLAYSF